MRATTINGPFDIRLVDAPEGVERRTGQEFVGVVEDLGPAVTTLGRRRHRGLDAAARQHADGLGARL